MRIAWIGGVLFFGRVQNPWESDHRIEHRLHEAGGGTQPIAGFYFLTIRKNCSYFPRGFENQQSAQDMLTFINL